MEIQDFSKYKKGDTSIRSRKEAKKMAIQAIKDCEGFMLFTVVQEKNQLNYRGNAYIEKPHAAGMPKFILKVLDQRKDQIQGNLPR